jgi:hypothetical protein
MRAMQKILRETLGGNLESRVTKRGFRARVMSSIWRPIANVAVIIRDDLLNSLVVNERWGDE